MLIVYVATKGGVGKTTISVHHAHWLHLSGYRVAFIDADPQEQSSRWLRKLEPKIEVVATRSPSEISSAAKRLQKSHDIVLADAPGGTTKQTVVLIQNANLCLLPMMVSPLDVFSTYSDARELIAQVKSHYGVNPEVRTIVNGLDMRTKLSRQILAAAKKMKPQPTRKSLRKITDLATVADIENPNSVFNLKQSKAKRELAELFSEVQRLVSRDVRSIAANE